MDPIETSGGIRAGGPDDSQTQQVEASVSAASSTWLGGYNRRKELNTSADSLTHHDKSLRWRTRIPLPVATYGERYGGPFSWCGFNPQGALSRCGEGMGLPSSANARHDGSPAPSAGLHSTHALASFRSLISQSRREPSKLPTQLGRRLSAVHRNVRSSLTQPIKTDMRADAVEPATNGLSSQSVSRRRYALRNVSCVRRRLLPGCGPCGGYSDRFCRDRFRKVSPHRLCRMSVTYRILAVQPTGFP